MDEHRINLVIRSLVHNEHLVDEVFQLMPQHQQLVHIHRHGMVHHGLLLQVGLRAREHVTSIVIQITHGMVRLV
jgi:hypothetical protein